MAIETLQGSLEFLVISFSAPDRDFFKGICEVETPLGELEADGPIDEYCDKMTEAYTDLFINSPKRRPLHPLATEYIEGSAAREDYLNRLVECYRSEGLAASGFPPDHLRVMYEFLLMRLKRSGVESAQKFYADFLEGCANRFAAAIFERNPPKFFKRLADLILDTGYQLQEL